MSLLTSPVTGEDAVRLLDEYFSIRDRGHPGGGYVITHPVAEHFEPPTGEFTILYDEGEPIGCGGVRVLTHTRCEIKHLFVRPSTRGRGCGRMLLDALEHIARRLGAQEVVLDTNASLDAANALYRSSGYREIPAYNDNPNATTWFSKQLDAAASHR